MSFIVASRNPYRSTATHCNHVKTAPRFMLGPARSRTIGHDQTFLPHMDTHHISLCGLPFLWRFSLLTASSSASYHLSSSTCHVSLHRFLRSHLPLPGRAASTGFLQHEESQRTTGSRELGRDELGRDELGRDKLHRGPRKVERSLAIQLRTGKIGFAAFLHDRRVPDITSPACQCG